MNGIENKKREKLNVRSISSVLGLIFTILLFLVWTRGSIARVSNLEVIVNQAYNIILIGVGAIFVFAYGGLDFSFGALIAACTLVITLLTRAGYPFWIAILASVLLGAFSGYLIGALSQYLRIPVFIVSLSFEYIWRGVTELGCATSLLYAPSEFTSLFNSWGIRIPVLLVFFVVFYLLYNKTRIGKYLRAAGGNMTAASLSGVKVSRYAILAHVFAGICVGATAVFSLARATCAIATTGNGLEMDVLIGLVLGGMAMGGGAGCKFSSILIGAFTQAILSNGLILVGMNQYWVEGISGAIFIVVVALSLKRAGRGKGSR